MLKRASGQAACFRVMWKSCRKATYITPEHRNVHEMQLITAQPATATTQGRARQRKPFAFHNSIILRARVTWPLRGDVSLRLCLEKQA